MSHSNADAILNFLQDPKNKPLKDLIELAANDDEEALNYVDFIQEEIQKKFATVDDTSNSLNATHLSVKLDPNSGQNAIKAIDDDMKYYFNEYGVLKNCKNIPNNLTYDLSEKLGVELVYYMFHILTNLYKFRAKIVGNSNVSKKKKKKIKDYKFKTILFSPKFEQCDNIVVLIPPNRACITYPGLCIDEGISYGTMLSYIDEILSWNVKVPVKKKNKKAKNNTTGTNKKKKKKLSNTFKKDDKNDNDAAKKAAAPRWGIMILDPQGQDTNNNKYSIIKIFDKWLSKRIPSVGIFGFHPRPADPKAHKRRDSVESITSMVSVQVGSGPRIKADIKNLWFVGGLQNGDLISHLFHRRGTEVQSVIKGCIFMGCDDPYDVNDITRSIYSKCGINYLNSTLPKNQKIDGKKGNGDPFIIKRVSSGNPRYCCQSAYPSVIQYIKDSIVPKTNNGTNDDQNDQNNDNDQKAD